MQVTLRKTDLLLLAGSLAGLLTFFLLGMEQFPEAGFRRPVPQKAVAERGLRFVQSLGYDLADWPSTVELKADEEQLRFLYESLPPQTAVSALRDSIPVYTWQIVWRPPMDSLAGEVNLHFGTDGGPGPRPGFPNSWTSYRLTLDAESRPLHFEYDDTSDTFVPFMQVSEGLDQNRAQRLGQRLLRGDERHWVAEEMTARESKRGPVRQFRWYREESVLQERAGLSVTLLNGRVVAFHKSYSPPKTEVGAESPLSWINRLQPLMYVLLFVLLVVHFVKRLRADLLDLRTGLVPVLFLLLGWGVQLFMGQVALRAHFLELAMGFLISGVILGGVVWAMFSVGESMTRQVWSDKLITYDAVRRRLLFPQTGLHILRGLAVALLGLGLYTGLVRLGLALGGHFVIKSPTFQFLASRGSVLHLVGNALFLTTLISVVFCLFVMTWVRHWLKKPGWVLLVTLVLWLFQNTALPMPMLSPLWLRLVVHGVMGLLFFWSFLRFDLLATASALFSLPLFYYGLLSLLLKSGGFWIQGLLLLAMPCLLMVYAFRAYHSDTSVEDVTAYVPDYMQRIYERERIQRELEIARHVQLTFLPRSTPQIPDLDIATLCLPAKEVGGDYYDFILNPGTLGVAIGDVSGKGISAAFYMTLTKGFLKAQTRIDNSPREVLIHINELFYENAERGMFISMILALFDLQKRTVTFARAGHNPMILHRSGSHAAEEVNVAGIALGLERGGLFEQTIAEETLAFEPGDQFLFYTDGLNEAQNLKKEEYGEERLLRLLETYNHLPAELQLDKIRRDIVRFTDGAPQHDDMTAVLVRILEGR